MLIVACICIAALLVAFPSRGNKNFLEMATADKPEDGVTRRSSFFEEATESSPADDGASSTARTRRHKHRKRRTTTTTTDESADEVTGRSYNDRIQEWTIDASEPDRATSNASEGGERTRHTIVMPLPTSVAQISEIPATAATNSSANCRGRDGTARPHR
ncbi:uncharacterized protein LOC144107484 isoform X1 [Amblyomma americanum]